MLSLRGATQSGRGATWAAAAGLGCLLGSGGVAYADASVRACVDFVLWASLQCGRGGARAAWMFMETS